MTAVIIAWWFAVSALATILLGMAIYLLAPGARSFRPHQRRAVRPEEDEELGLGS